VTAEQPTQPNDYVRQNRQDLVEILKHGTDPFARALALAALVEFGDEPDIERVRHELEQAVQLEGSQ